MHELTNPAARVSAVRCVLQSHRVYPTEKDDLAWAILGLPRGSDRRSAVDALSYLRIRQKLRLVLSPRAHPSDDTEALIQCARTAVRHRGVYLDPIRHALMDPVLGKVWGDTELSCREVTCVAAVSLLSDHVESTVHYWRERHALLMVVARRGRARPILSLIPRLWRQQPLPVHQLRELCERALAA